MAGLMKGYAMSLISDKVLDFSLQFVDTPTNTRNKYFWNYLLYLDMENPPKFLPLVSFSSYPQEP